MNIEKLFTNKELIDKELAFFEKKKHIKKIETNHELTQSFLLKAQHNLSFYSENKSKEQYNDWLIVILYYALYHCALALITHRSYSSKNHFATILILIKEYSISQDEAKLIDELAINKGDAELYTNLKKDRHNASYTTNMIFTKENILNYEEQVVSFIQKTKELLSE